jgi:hypothetical protein
MKITRQEAENILPEMWSNAVVDSDFTEEHSEYEETVKSIIRHGYFDYDDYFN